MSSNSIPFSTPIRLQNVAFPDRYLDVSGSIDGGNLIGYPNNGTTVDPGLNQIFVFKSHNPLGNGGFYIRSLVLKDENGNLYPKAKMVSVHADQENGSYLRAGSKLIPSPTLFEVKIDQSGAYRIRTFGLANLYLTLPNGGTGTKVELLPGASVDKPEKQLWRVIKPEWPSGFPVPGFDE